MRVRFFPLIVVCLVCAFSADAQTVIENETQIILGEESSTVVLNLDSGAAATGTNASVSFLSPSDEIKYTTAVNVTIAKGKNRIEIPVSIADIVKEQDFAFYRLRYALADSSGTISLSQIVGDIFDIEAFAFDMLQKGSIYRVRSRSIQSAKLKGVANVRMSGVLEVEYEDGTKDELTSTTVTDADGFGDFDFVLDPAKKIDEIELTLTGTKNGFSRKLERDVPEYQLKRYSYLYFQTDKPLYQPDQMLKVRTLFFDDKKKALSGAPLVFMIKDPEGMVMQTIEATTSRFGIASIEWQVPENAKLGEYSVAVKSTRELFRDEKQFKVSRYDLPNFAVKADSNQKFYLPESKTASVKVSADYLFGKAVTNAKVRVVRETDREWDSKTGRYITKEGAVREGILDADGKFTADFDLTEEHEDYESADYKKFEDLNFAAYVTDLTTNKTEQKRFDIRLTKKPIHIYLSGTSGDLSKRLPARVFLTAFYPDGTPAECDIAIYREHEDSDDDDKPKLGKMLVKAKTNRTGAAKVFIPFNVLDEDDDEIDLVVTAKDSDGRRSFLKTDINFDSEKPAVQVSTDKVVYRQGEPLRVSIISSESDAVLFIDVMQGSQNLSNEKVRLQGGKAVLEIPFAASFKGSISITAYAAFRNEYGNAEVFSDSRTVAYPSPRGLMLKADSAKTVYRPGEEATVNFSSVKSNGIAPETVFGVAVLDKAIEERARTDSEFGGRYRSFYSDFEDILGYSQGFAGLSGFAIDNMDTSQPLSPEAELAIEIGLNNYVHQPELEESGNLQRELNAAYKYLFDRQFAAASTSLANRFYQQNLAAVDAASLKSILALDKINLDSMVDPWGNPFRMSVSRSREDSKIIITSDGADEKADTPDDVEAFSKSFRYFTGTGAQINKAFANYHDRTEEFILNYKTLRNELKRQNFDLDKLRDAWGERYRFDFGIEASNFALNIKSGGWDRKFGKYDDFTIWTHRSDYFEVLRANMSAAFRDHVRKTETFPGDEAEFKNVLRSTSFDLDTMKDIYARPYYIGLEKVSRYADRKTIGSKAGVVPVTRDLVTYTIKSSGSDGIKNNSDDFELARFIGIVSETEKDGQSDKRVKAVPASSASLGAIAGRVMDTNGAVIPNASITVIWNYVKRRAISSDDEGYFVVADLSPGSYELTFESPGFKKSVIQNVAVTAQNLTEIDIVLEVGGTSEVVTVTSDAQSIDASSSSISTTITQSQIMNLPLNGRRISAGVLNLDGVDSSTDKKVDTKSGKSPNQSTTVQQIETPRLREYFPETLVWFPELISSLNGTAQIKFKLADSMTTWKIGVIGSTEDGDIGMVEKEITAFQPFFVDLDPPKFLTDGDEISLPVQVRNYTEKMQKVDVSMAKGDWFSFLAGDRQQIDVEAGNSQNAIFAFKAVSPIKDGKQNVTAIAGSDSDAIEKPVTVRPNGQEIVKTDSKLFNGSEKFEVNFPADALPKTHKAELKIYPNLFSHVAESVEGLLQRPYGCGEQTISSTYPNLMILKFKTGDTVLQIKARKYLQKGYERLLGYQSPDGGFTYWGGKEAPDIALTAYALRFLKDAKSVIAVDDEAIIRAEVWLIKQQRADGSWSTKYYYDKTEDLTRTIMLTTYLARSLALNSADSSTAESKAPLQKALGYLHSNSAGIDEPYALALFGLALHDSGNTEAAAVIARKLEGLAIAEGNSAYWKLETNTPFYGWGTAGRVETTALAAQLLIKVHGGDRKSGDLISKGILFLLKNKDRYGVWHSTQTTINVLDTFIASLAGDGSQKPQNLQVFVNGENVENFTVSPNRIDPVTLNLNGRLNATANNVEVRSSDSSPQMAQIVSSHYIGWQDANPSLENLNQSRALRLDYKCDKLEAAVMQEVTCSVEAERIRFQGYGMLLAEIGTPPGADVSRESLEKAVNADGSISRYDILPDRIVVYMWAKAGGTKFTFKFRPRYRVYAQTPASVVYDYYNPEAQATAMPLKFQVR